MVRKVWLIEDGDYSDYQVYGVFSTPNNASKVAQAMGLGKDTVKEWVLDPMVTELNKGYSQYVLLMLRDGKVESIRKNEYIRYSSSKAFIWDRPNAPAYKNKGIPAVLDATVLARDEKHAVKIVNEIRTHMIAENKW